VTGHDLVRRLLRRPSSPLALADNHTIHIALFTEGGPSSLDTVVVGGVVPTHVGEEFTLRITKVTREVVES
jgi:hypothetical protein